MCATRVQPQIDQKYVQRFCPCGQIIRKNNTHVAWLSLSLSLDGRLLIFISCKLITFAELLWHVFRIFSFWFV